MQNKKAPYLDALRTYFFYITLIPIAIRTSNTIHTNPTNIENSGNPKCPSIIHRIQPIRYRKTSIQFIH